MKKTLAKYLDIVVLVLTSIALLGCAGPSIPQKDFDALQAHLAASEAELASKTKDLDNTKTQLASAQGDYNDAKIKLDTAQVEIKKLQDSLASQTATLTTTQQLLTQMQG